MVAGAEDVVLMVAVGSGVPGRQDVIVTVTVAEEVVMTQVVD